MNALLSSLAMHLLTDGDALPVTMDISTLDPGANRLGLWHCGACPTRWLKRGTLFEARRHSILENAGPDEAVGLMLEFLLELGSVTVARYQSPDAAKMYCFEGDLVDTEMAFRGSYGELHPAHGVTAAQIMGTILSAGLDHHWSVGYGHLAAKLEMLNHWLGISAIGLSKPDAVQGLSE